MNIVHIKSCDGRVKGKADSKRDVESSPVICRRDKGKERVSGVKVLEEALLTDIRVYSEEEDHCLVYGK